MKIHTIIDDQDLLLTSSTDFIFGVDDPQLFCSLREATKELGTKAVGLAAIQIGVPKRVFIFSKDQKIIINPKVKIASLVTSNKEEGCLSVPSFYTKIRRPSEIVLEYSNEVGELVTEKFTGLEARIVAHEMDHLNGKLIVHRKKASGHVKEKWGREKVPH